MTETRQTTAERIQREIDQYYGHGPNAPETSPLSRDIAARINAMIDRCHATEAAMATQTRQVTELRATIDRLQRELAEARAYISTIIDAPGEGG